MVSRRLSRALVWSPAFALARGMPAPARCPEHPTVFGDTRDVVSVVPGVSVASSGDVSVPAKGGAKAVVAGDDQGPSRRVVTYRTWDEMTHTLPTRRRWLSRARSPGLGLLLALALVSCGATNTMRHSVQRQQVAARSVPRASAGREPARIPPARPVPLVATPASLLAVCLKNSLLRPICPRLGPRANEPHTSIRPLGLCVTRAGGDVVLAGRYGRLASSACVDADWGYEAIGWPPGFLIGKPTTISGWDPVTRILGPPEALLISPPVHVHIEIEASLGGLIGEASWPAGAHPVSDRLLSPTRTRPVSLGWVRWYGRYGQLVLEPIYPFGGEWGGHLIFRFNARRVNYAITLHAWMPAVRLTATGVNRVIAFQSGAALPHVIATLKAIVGSALRG